MAKVITIQEFAEEMKGRLQSVTNLNAVYIGKTQNLVSAEYRHSKEYDKTIPIALGAPEVISKAEDYPIKSLKSSLTGITIDNIKAGSAGNTDADMLYVSLDFSPETVFELDDDDIIDEPYSLIG